ncbi:flagellar biosynthetic protein FliQ [Sphingobium boeckii]|uniref:Flagellar biosynthetic protein FliQ n=1 Tax=Sphingobium boeckii TaxID=1082345 RepID=A0A7W9AGG4_9SPHN|nr:flagellar biosynthetic protein FliQ [Sphingobium boeckii]MBB5685222.1 flagellar biosynthetic protein FliQ [Sphingobium boeckii]
MDSLQAIDLARAGLVLVLTVAGPMLITSLIVGVSIGLLQALTQVQEMTLTFVPKILIMGLVLLLSLPMIGQALSTFMTRISDMIITGGA